MTTTTALSRPAELKLHLRGAINNGVTKDGFFERHCVHFSRQSPTRGCSRQSKTFEPMRFDAQTLLAVVETGGWQYASEVALPV